jgi:hypothetical protein
MPRFGASSRYDTRVILNVYDLGENNDMLFPLGLGLYHSGVQIGNYEEYTFASGGGVFSHAPKKASGAKFRLSVDMGAFHGTSEEIGAIINSLRGGYRGEDYNILSKNCNCFANDLCNRIVNKDIPGYVNRMAYIGSQFSCLFPDSVTGNAPVDSAGGSSSRGGSMRSNPSVQKQPFSSSTGYKLAAIDASGDTASLLTKEERREQMRKATMTRQGQENSA